MTSIIPFDVIYQVGGFNKIARISRISKIYKLVRMTKIIRLIKIVKVKNKFVRHLADILKIGAGTERLIYMLITFFVLQHITACIW